jgi:uncharacterized protein (TIGR03435 family)
MQNAPAGLLLFTSLVAWAQAGAGRDGGKLEFDVATIKPAAPGRDGGIVRILPGGRTFTASNVALKYLLVTAFGVTPGQVSGGPGWVNSDGYDIEAKTSQSVSGDELMLMLRALLTDRFQLTLRNDQKVQQVYELALDKAGAKLRANKDGGELTLRPDGKGQFIATNVTMAYLCWTLGRFPDAGRPVVDKTGLKGGYDFELQYTPVFRAPDGGAADTGPSLFTALREQLGLKLESAKDPIDFYTIEHAERPSGN